jgi:N-acetylmuramoyl-L-alanine amidase
VRQHGILFPAVILTVPLLAAALLQTSPEQTPAPQPTPAPQAPASQSPPPRPALGIVVIDAAHGGTDSGARGESGVIEKDVVATLAQSLKHEFERQGVRVVLTRSGDLAPSFADRAALANALPGAVFLTLHVASSGPVGTAIAYSLAPPAAPAPSGSKDQAPAAVPAFLTPWEDAQLRFMGGSRRLAELLQIQLAQKFKGSPETPQRGAIRQLRLVEHPAVAVEIASAAVEQRQQLDRMAPGLAEAFLRALEAFRQPAEAGKP